MSLIVSQYLDCSEEIGDYIKECDFFLMLYNGICLRTSVNHMIMHSDKKTKHRLKDLFKMQNNPMDIRGTEYK